MSNLFIKIDYGYNPETDTDGTRPYTGTNALWNNASIFLTGGANQTQTSVGTPTIVRVRVSNSLQTAAPNVFVEAFVMNPFVGGFFPQHAITTLRNFAPQSIAPGSGGTSPTDGHVVPCVDLATNQPWMPTAAQLAQSTGGHLCVVANVYDDDEGSPAGSITDFDVVNNPHLGQRNIALMAAGMAQKLEFMVMPAPEGEATALDFHRLALSFAQERGAQWLLRSEARISAMDQGSLRLGIPKRGKREAIPLTMSRKGVVGTLEVDGFGSADLQPLARTGKALAKQLLAAEERRAIGWGDGRLVLPEAREPRFATMNLHRADRPGSVQVFDIVQRTANGRVLGGLRILSMQS